LAVTVLVSRFLTAAAGGNTMGLLSNLPANVPLSSDRLSGDP
jgi:hypothetical protein